jgi:hypothetical protein
MTTKDIVLLLVPTAISLASFYISAQAYRKDTSKLNVEANYTLALNAYPTLSIVISNVGKRATTIMEAGYRVNHQFHLNLLERDGKRASGGSVGIVDIKLIKNYVAIGPGEVRRSTFILDHWPNHFVHADMPLIPYAKDINGKYFYGSQQAYLRRLISGGGLITGIPKKFYDTALGQFDPLTRSDLHPNSKFIKILDKLDGVMKKYVIGQEADFKKKE